MPAPESKSTATATDPAPERVDNPFRWADILAIGTAWHSQDERFSVINVYRSSKNLGQFDEESFTLHSSDADLTELFRNLTSTQVELEKTLSVGEAVFPRVPEALPNDDFDVPASDIE